VIQSKKALGLCLALFLVSSAGFSRTPAKALAFFEVRPTVAFVQDPGVLKQVYLASVENLAEPMPAEVSVRLSGKAQVFPLTLAKGKQDYTLTLPEAAKPTRVKFVLTAGQETRSFETVLVPQRKWTVYLFHHSHSDIGYTELQTRVFKKQAEYLDSVIDYCRQTNDYPDDAKFRWNCEISWAVENYIKQRPPEKVKELMDLIKAGRVDVGAWYLNQSDMFSHEELIRSVYYARELARTYGLPITCAMNDDVTGFSWASPAVLSGSGVRYFTTGINETRSRAPLRRPCAFYWVSPDGSRILTWNGEQYLYANTDLRIHEGVGASFPKVTDYLGRLEARGDFPYDLIAFNVGAYITDNCPPGRALSDIVRDWNSRYVYPKLRLATMHDFFQSFEGKYGDRLPSYRQAWPDYWTDGVASTAFETGLNRKTHQDLISGETFAALAKAVNPDFVYPASEIYEGYSNSMFYDEHTWGGWNSIDDPESEFAKSQWTLKSAFAYISREISRTVLTRSTAGIARLIPSKNKYSLAVFNPLSWERTDVASLGLPQPLVDLKGRFQVRDERTGREVPFELADEKTVLFAANVPAMGYAVYSILPDRAPTVFKSKASAQGNVLENDFFKVVIDPVTGGLSSLYDKQLKAELRDSAGPYTLNQYVYENPEGGRKAVDDMEKRATFVRSSPASAGVTAGIQGPVASSLVAVASAKRCPRLESRYILYDDLKRVDIVNTLTKEETYDPEAVYFAFPFNVDKGKFRFEISDAVMRPEDDQLPGTVRDWMTVQNWVEAARPGLSVLWSPVEAPLVQFGDINTGKWLKKLDLSNTTLFSYAMNNYWMTNFKAGQGGTLVFRYSLTSHEAGQDAVRAGRFGNEVHQPLTVAWLTERPEGTLAAGGQSFLSLDKPNVMIQAVKMAEDGRGLIIRLREFAGRDTPVKITSPLFSGGKVNLTLTDVAEADGESRLVSGDDIVVIVKSFGIRTIRLQR
jgi:hypothetical protein